MGSNGVRKMRRIIALLLSILLLVSMVGCTEEEAPANTNSQANSQPAVTDHYDDRISDEALFTMLFDIQNQITLSLDMSDEELAKMQADYDRYDRNGGKSPIYRMGDLQITITTPDGTQYSYTIREVGVRMKGNTSRTDFYSREDGIYNIIHLKLSFQETFDDPEIYGTDIKTWDDAARKERTNRTFATLEKLDLRWNRCDDSTYLKEYFAYATYREYGVLAPHTNLTSFDWAGNHMGVFTLNEPIDEVFLAKNLPAEALGGDLYKIGWAGNRNGSFTNLSSIGIENEEAGEFYAYDLKTNKKTSTHEALTSLIRSLNSGSVSKENFAELVDIETFLPYCAVSYLLGNPDDLRNNYNNSYLYFRPDNGKAVIIPYDFDRCLGITMHWNPTGNAVTGDDPFGTTLLATGESQENPLFLYSVTRGGHYVTEYAQILMDIMVGRWFTYDNFASLYSIAEANYSHLTKPSKSFNNAQHLYQQMDLDRTSDFSANENISIGEYLEAKLTTLRSYLKKTEENADAPGYAPPGSWYARGDYTNWNVDPNHTLTSQGELWVYNATFYNTVKLKLFHTTLDAWYGSECVAEDCTVPFRTDSHTNIILTPGSYRIAIDPNTGIITIEEQ